MLCTHIFLVAVVAHWMLIMIVIGNNCNIAALPPGHVVHS